MSINKEVTNIEPSNIAQSASFVCNQEPAVSHLRSALENDQEEAVLSKAFRSYYRVRRFIPIFLRQILQRGRNKSFELPNEWYIPREFIRGLAQSLTNSDLEVIHPWPNGCQFSTVLSHDVETIDGLKNIDKMAKIEEKHGMRSSWNLVPHFYPIDEGIVKDLIQRGFEIGVHGYNHDGRLFESKRVFRKRSHAINQAAKRFSATGFRAPMVHRDLDLIDRHLKFEYDASCFDIDPLQAMPGGVGSIWPFVIRDSIVELPYTMPQDHTLFVSLGHTDTKVWQTKFDFLRRNGGMVLLLTHPDYMDSVRRLDLYDRFLGQLNEQEGVWNATPREVARWWKFRDSVAIQNEPSPTTESSCGSQLASTRARMYCENEEVRFEPIHSGP